MIEEDYHRTESKTCRIQDKDLLVYTYYPPYFHISICSRYYNSWIEVEEEPESEAAASEVKSSDVESKEELSVEDSLMELNKIEAPSVCASVGDDDLSWGSEKRSDEDIARSFSSSDDELEDLVNIPAKSSNPESSEDIMFRRNIEDSYIQFGSSLACEVSFRGVVN